jgi:excisionase family DNA binding protein
MDFNASKTKLSEKSKRIGKELAAQEQPSISEKELKEVIERERKKLEKESATPKGVYLTIQQAAEYLNVSKMTIWRRTKDGTLKPKKFGGKVLYARADIDDYLNNQNSCSHE